MSVLMEVLQEELDRLDRQQVAYEAALAELPKGYVSKKNIRGNISHYLQYRDGEKIRSEYISLQDLPAVQEQIQQQNQRRQQLKASLNRVKEDRKKLRKVLKAKDEREV